MGNRTRDLPASSAVPQSTTLPRASTGAVTNEYFDESSGSITDGKCLA
jgi:hypothetical protein